MATRMDDEELLEFVDDMAQELFDSGFPGEEVVAAENVFNQTFRSCRIGRFRWRTPMADISFTC